MKYLLDTSICVGLLRGKAPRSASKLRTVPSAELSLCSIVIYELLLGTEKCNNPAAEIAKVRAFTAALVSLAFDDDCAAECAKIRASLEKAGITIGPYDFQIAATAKRHGLIVVTRNAAEFQRVHGLKVEDWER